MYVLVGVKSCIEPGRSCEREVIFKAELQIEAYQNHGATPILPDLITSPLFPDPRTNNIVQHRECILIPPGYQPWYTPIMTSIKLFHRLVV